MYLTDDEVETLLANVGATIGLLQGQLTAAELPTGLLELAHDMGGLETETEYENLTSFMSSVIGQVGGDNTASTLATLVAIGVLRIDNTKFFETFLVEDVTNEIH